MVARMFNMNRFGQCTLNRPTVIESLIECWLRHIKNSRPFAKCVNLILKCYKAGSSSIARLFFASSPTAVFGRIISVILNSLKRKSFFVSRSHISDKFLNIIPSHTYFYSPAAIAIIITILLPLATIVHITPCLVKKVTAKCFGKFILLFDGRSYYISFIHDCFLSQWSCSEAVSGTIRSWLRLFIHRPFKMFKQNPIIYEVKSSV